MSKECVCVCVCVVSGGRMLSLLWLAVTSQSEVFPSGNQMSPSY